MLISSYLVRVFLWEFEYPPTGTVLFVKLHSLIVPYFGVRYFSAYLTKVLNDIIGEVLSFSVVSPILSVALIFSVHATSISRLQFLRSFHGINFAQVDFKVFVLLW